MYYYGEWWKFQDKKDFPYKFQVSGIYYQWKLVNYGVMQHISQFKMVNKNQLHLAINANYYDVCDVKEDWFSRKKYFKILRLFFVNKRLDSLYICSGKPAKLKRWFKKMYMFFTIGIESSIYGTTCMVYRNDWNTFLNKLSNRAMYTHRTNRTILARNVICG